MSTVVADSKYPRHQVVHFLLSTIIGITIVSLFFMDDKAYELRLRHEVSEAMKFLRDEEWYVVKQRIESRFNSFYYETGFYDQVTGLLLPKNTEDNAANNLIDESFSYRAVNNISYFIYQIIYRLTTFEYWLSLLLPMMMCIMIQGFNRWRINRYKMGGAKTSRARLYMKLVWTFSITVVVMLSTPNYFTSLSFYIPAIVLLGITLGASKYISTFQKDF